MRMFHSGSLWAYLMLIALLASCGQKGPLYLPMPQAQPASSEQQKTATP